MAVLSGDEPGTRTLEIAQHPPAVDWDRPAGAGDTEVENLGNREIFDFRKASGEELAGGGVTKLAWNRKDHRHRFKFPCR